MTPLQTVQKLLSFMGITAEAVEAKDAQGTVIRITTAESGLLIGNHGDTLSAINQLVKKIHEKELVDGAHLSVDVNGYLARRVEALEAEAKLLAERARTFRYDIEMSPMSSYERMVIHATLKDMPDIETMSVGEGKLRHIVVRYKDPNAPSAPVPTAEDSVL
ncbi:MAG: single-stranded nucleic acid binding spoIIIJ-associated protein [Candidatus Parcubacteria bacterium]